MTVIKILLVAFALCYILPVNAQVKFINITQQDPGSNHLYTCLTNVIKLDGVQRGFTVIMKHTTFETVEKTLFIKSPVHNDGEKDTLYLRDANGDVLTQKVFVYDTCIADKSKGHYWWNKNLFFAGVTNVGVLQGDYRDFSMTLSLATIKANPILSISNANYRISHVVFTMGCPTCDFGLPIIFNSGDLSPVLQHLQLFRLPLCTRFFLSEIQCTNIHNKNDVQAVSNIFVRVK